MENEVDIKHKLKNLFLELFEDAVPGDNGSIESFSDVEKEYHSLTKGVGVRCISTKLIVKLTGNDVQDFLHRVSTNDINSLGVFKQVNTLFTNEKGRLIDRTTLLKIGDYYLLVGSHEPEKRLLSWIEKFVIMEDINIEDVSDQYVIFEFIGAQVKSFMTMMCGDKCNDLDGERITLGETGSIKTYFTKVKEVNDIDKYWALVSASDAINFVNYLNDHRSVFDFHFVGDKVYNYFRIKNSIPVFPNEINTNYNPHEVGLLEEVNFKKGCYIGQEVIARLDTYDKVQRAMKLVHLNEEDRIELPSEIFKENGDVCGELTSLSDLEPGNNKIGLALIKKKALENNSDFFIKQNGKEIKIYLREAEKNK